MRSREFNRSIRLRFYSCAILLATGIISIGGGLCVADPTTQPAKQAVHRPLRDAKTRAALMAELTSGDDARVAAAVKGIEDEAKRHEDKAKYLEIVLDAKQYKPAADAALDLVLADPAGVMSVDGLTRLRANALLASKQFDQALPAAKAYYNVCRLKNTADAITLVALCLAKARPQDADVVHRFKLEQMASADPAPASTGGDTTAVARALRAESGCVAPANAYILKMRNQQQQ